MGRQDYDPITLEIIQNSLQAAADEMFAAMRKTAMSSIIYEVLDMGTGNHGPEGRKSPPRGQEFPLSSVCSTSR